MNKEITAEDILWIMSQELQDGYAEANLKKGKTLAGLVREKGRTERKEVKTLRFIGWSLATLMLFFAVLSICEIAIKNPPFELGMIGTLGLIFVLFISTIGLQWKKLDSKIFPTRTEKFREEIVGPLCVFTREVRNFVQNDQELLNDHLFCSSTGTSYAVKYTKDWMQKRLVRHAERCIKTEKQVRFATNSKVLIIRELTDAVDDYRRAHTSFDAAFASAVRFGLNPDRRRIFDEAEKRIANREIREKNQQ